VLTTDQLRERNLSDLVATLHRDGPLSRKALTTRLGVTRSTMGVLLADLSARGLVVELPPVADGGVGRPSPVQRLDARTVAVAVDIAVDAVQIALVGPTADVRARRRIGVTGPLTVAAVSEIVVSAIDDLLRGESGPLRVLGLGVGVPGQVRAEDGTVREADHLGWSDEPLAAHLARATGLTVRAANAATLDLRAECTFGAGRGLDDVLHVVGGASGIGGGFVGKGGVRYEGAGGYAGEIGHTVVLPGGRPCHCGARGCLEAEVTRRELLEVVDLDATQFDGLAACLVERRDDPPVAAELRRSADLFAVAVRNAVNLLNPSTVIVAGFLGALVVACGPERFVAGAIRSSRADVRVVPVVRPDPAQVLIGAAELVCDDLIASPARSLPVL
jgi:predicted NBD/HSP70 family sugar kinase